MPFNTQFPNRELAEFTERWRQRDRPILAYGLMLVFAVSLVLNRFTKFPSFPEEVADSFRRYCDHKLPLQVETSDLATVERYFVAEGVPFAVRTLDPASYELKGARVERIRNRKSSWVAYQGTGNKRFVLQMYPGNLGEWPAGAEIRWGSGRSFHIYAGLGLTVVAWQENRICCVLISDAPVEETVRLAQGWVTA